MKPYIQSTKKGEIGVRIASSEMVEPGMCFRLSRQSAFYKSIQGNSLVAFQVAACENMAITLKVGIDSYVRLPYEDCELVQDPTVHGFTEAGSFVDYRSFIY